MVLLILAAAGLGIFYFFLIERIPPRDMTITRMSLIETRARAYWRMNGRGPAGLSELPPLEGRDNQTVDGWGRPIDYVLQSSSLATLTSLGSDQQPGGSGDAADIVYRFDLARAP